jgi:hypothetical protein
VNLSIDLISIVSAPNPSNTSVSVNKKARTFARSRKVEKRQTVSQQLQLESPDKFTAREKPGRKKQGHIVDISSLTKKRNQELLTKRAG